MIMACRIAVLEGDPGLRRVITDYLRLHGFAPQAFADAAALEAALREHAADIVLLDPTPARHAAPALIAHLRTLPARPGIILLGSPAAGSPGPAAAPDDSIARPFPLRALLDRIRGLLRRRAAAPRDATPPASTPGKPGFRPVPPTPETVRVGTYTLCRSSRRLLDAARAEVPLTPMEMDLLLLLADHPAEVLSRERLLVMAHGKDVDPLDRSIDIRITRLRRKIEADPANPRLIRTIRGQGYVFTPEDA